MRATLLTFALLLLAAAGAEAQIRPDPGGTVPGVAVGEAGGPRPADVPPERRFAGPCLEPRDRGFAVSAIGFEGRSFKPIGSPQPVSAANLDPVGEHRGVPLFAGKLAARPVADLWVPVCAPPDHYQLYTRLPGTAGPGGS